MRFPFGAFRLPFQTFRWGESRTVFKGKFYLFFSFLILLSRFLILSKPPFRRKSGYKVNSAESRIIVLFIRLCLLIKTTVPVIQVMDLLSKETSKTVDVKFSK